MARRNVDLRVTIDADARRLERAVGQANRSMGQFNRTIDVAAKHSRVFTMAGLALSAAGAAIGLGLRAAARESTAFDSRLTKSVTLIGVSRVEMDRMGQAALRMGDTGQGPQALADALFFAQSAGLRGAEAMSVVEASAKAASIGLGDTATITDTVTSATNAYGIENLSAADATDILINAVRQGKLEASELAPVLGRILPIASEMGVQFHEVGAATAAMTRTGTDASTAATQLRQILLSMLKPTAQTERALDGIGLSSEKLRDVIRKDGLWAALMMLREAVGDNDEMLAQIFPNVRALTGFLNLTGEAAAENAVVFDEMADSTGVLSEAFAEWSTTTEAAQMRFSAAMEAAKISLGAALQEPMKAVLDTGTGLLQLFVDLPAPAQTAATFMGIAGAGASTLAGGFLLAAPRILSTKAALADLAKVMPKTVGLLRGAGTLLMGPFGVALGLAAVALFGFAQAKAEATRQIAEFVAALDADMGVIGQSTRATAVLALEQAGALEPARQLGIATGDLTEALLGNEEAYDQVMLVLDEYEGVVIRGRQATGGARAENVENAKSADLIRRALEKLNPRFAESVDEQRRLAEATAEANGTWYDAEHVLSKGLPPALEATHIEMLRTRDETDRLTGSMIELDDEIEPLDEALEDLADRFGLTGDDAAKAAQSMVDSWTAAGGRFVDILGAYTQALADKEADERDAAMKTAEATGDASKSWEDFIGDVALTVDEYLDELERMVKNQLGWRDNLVRITGRVSDEMLGILLEMGPEGADLVALLGTMSQSEIMRFERLWLNSTDAAVQGGIIDPVLAANPVLRDIARKHGRDVADGVRDYMIKHGVGPEEAAKALGVRIDKGLRSGEERTIPVEVLGVETAIRRIESVDSKIRGLPSNKNIMIAAMTGTLNMRAAGGPIDGPGPRGVDSVPLLAAPGEYVMKAEARRKYGDRAMAAINEGAAEIVLPWGGPIRSSNINVKVKSDKVHAADFVNAAGRVAAAWGRSQATSSGRILPPGTYRIGRGSRAHGYGALDLPAPTGTPVSSVSAGIVARALRLATSYGIHAFINHPGNRQSRYAHFSQMYVRAGQVIPRGRMIGRVGSTGNSTGPHLHYEDLLNGIRRRPESMGLFDRGGKWPHGWGGVNLSGGTEYVLDPGQSRTFDRFVTAMEGIVRGGDGSAAGHTYVTNWRIEGTSEDLIHRIETRAAHDRITRELVTT